MHKSRQMPDINNIDQPVTQLKGVGATLAQKLAKLGISSLQHLLFHLPRQYSDRTQITPIGALRPHQYVLIEGEIRGTDIVFGRRRSLLCRVQDNTGTVSLRFYHFSNAQRTALASGRTIRCFGETRRGASGLEFYHPEYQVLSANEQKPALEQTLTPIYSITEGVSQTRLRALIKQALEKSKNLELACLLPTDKRDVHSLMEALEYLHSPPKQANMTQLLSGQHPYQQTLIMEELTAYQLSLLSLRKKRRQQSSLALELKPTLYQQFLEQLAFPLTGAQQRVINDIQQDLTQAVPMMRLLQGDVGSGKTVVAAVSALQAVANQQQVAIMAPTDILADQHKQTFITWFAAMGIRIGWLSGKQKVGERREELAALASGETAIVIGTHALFQEEVIFNKLALVIIDEQHRFGVHQRLSLRNKGTQTIPHQLIMTATPIPRTLAMSAYADLDYSVIDELPKGRIPVETVLISQQKRQLVIERIQHACLEGRQAYWVCTLIEKSESLEAEAAEETMETLKALLPNLNIGLVHGRLPQVQKDDIMSQFKAGELHLLVATTVIEVGVDVPNASLMIIENPERLGLAQLHQLRGRVGRGSAASHCVLLYGENLSQNGKERLQAMRSTSDGFKIADIDLQLRGPGEVLGTKQTGDIDFILADLRRDLHLMPDVKICAQTLVNTQPEQAQALVERWLKNNENYANV